MVRIRHHIPEAKERKPDTEAASVIYNATRRQTKRHGIRAATRVVCNATRRLGDISRLIISLRVQGSVKAVRAARNTRGFLSETRFVADEGGDGNNADEEEEASQADYESIQFVED
jgi:hypothetical protein